MTRIQEDSDKVINWFKKNDMICSGDKTKLLLITSRANRASKLTGAARGIIVDGKHKVETESEKLLGLVVNNSCTWKNHLYGDAENLGLIKQLSQRVGILRRLKKFLPAPKFKQIINGIYYSKQIYCLTVFGGLWGLPGSMDEENRKSIMLTKEDMRKLQVLQNSVMRITTSSRYDTPTSELLRKCDQLSIHQLMGYHTATQVYSIKKNRFPLYHFERLFGGNNSLLSRSNLVSRVEFKSSLGRGSFFYQGSRLWNYLPNSLKNAPDIKMFKLMTKPWIRSNISIRPE